MKTVKKNVFKDQCIIIHTTKRITCMKLHRMKRFFGRKCKKKKKNTKVKWKWFFFKIHRDFYESFLFNFHIFLYFYFSHTQKSFHAMRFHTSDKLLNMNNLFLQKYMTILFKSDIQMSIREYDTVNVCWTL